MAIKLKQPTLTRKELHQRLCDDGLNDSFSQVNKYNFRGIETDHIAHEEQHLMRSYGALHSSLPKNQTQTSIKHDRP
jgi:hypothetical protein